MVNTMNYFSSLMANIHSKVIDTVNKIKSDPKIK